jgi:hypothetical protein
MSYHLSDREKCDMLAEYCSVDRSGQAAARMESNGLLRFIGRVKVIRNEHAPREVMPKADLAAKGIPRETIEALENADVNHSAARAFSEWRSKQGVRGRVYGLLLWGEGKGKTVAACMAIDSRYTRNDSHHVRLCVPESELIRLIMGRSKGEDVSKYQRAQTLVVDSIGMSGSAYGRGALAEVVEMCRKRWSNGLPTILTSRRSLEDLAKTYGDSWAEVVKYCHMVEVG